MVSSFAFPFSRYSWCDGILFLVLSFRIIEWLWNLGQRWSQENSQRPRNSLTNFGGVHGKA